MELSDENTYSHNQDVNPFRQTLLENITQLPTQPGVYLHHDSNDTIIYVGKAKNLRSRIRQYLDTNRIVDAKTKVLMRKIARFEVIVTDSEAEALLLENTLIKLHKPKYNILLKDDKSFPFIRVTNEEFPRVFSTRTVIKDGSSYYGPYTDSKYLFYLLKTLRSIFPLRSCDLPLKEETIAANKYKVCLDYHIQKCEGMCQGFASKQSYNQHIQHVKTILSGKIRVVEKQLEEEMMLAAEVFEFEKAALLRNRLNNIREFTAKQKVVSTDNIERDIFAYARDDSYGCVLMLLVRDGKLIGKRVFTATNILDKSDSELLEQALTKCYEDSVDLPEEILLPIELDNIEFYDDWLSKIKGKRIDISVPKIGERKKLIAMATANAEYNIREYYLQQAKKDDAIPRAVASLQRDLRLTKTPRRIECFDNSHLQGTDYVSSMVVFIDGRPKKSEYRKYKISSFEGNDDFRAMQEVVDRRYSRALAEKTALPDLIIIDGGKGQLSHAVEILRKKGLESIAVIGLAKRMEEVFLPGESDSVFLPRTSSSLRLIQQLRDEAHRFAITFHRELRSKRTLRTELTDVPGVGEKTSVKLLTVFGSVTAIKAATHEQLQNVVGKSQAAKVFQYFQSLESNQQKDSVE